jgi:hypothetical protein
MKKVSWTDEEVVACRKRQDAWYQWCTYVEWAKAWETYMPQWACPWSGPSGT